MHPEGVCHPAKIASPLRLDNFLPGRIPLLAGAGGGELTRVRWGHRCGFQSSTRSTNVIAGAGSSTTALPLRARVPVPDFIQKWGAPRPAQGVRGVGHGRRRRLLVIWPERVGVVPRLDWSVNVRMTVSNRAS